MRISDNILESFWWLLISLAMVVFSDEFFFEYSFNMDHYSQSEILGKILLKKVRETEFCC